MKTKLEHAERWIKLAEKASEAADGYNKLGCAIEAHKKLLVSKYCYKRYTQTLHPMLTRKKDRILNIAGAIFSIGLTALIIYLIINKK